jgi:hypothetical protein
MKTSPSEATAIEVGMHRWFLLEPGTKRWPNVRTGVSSPGLNWGETDLRDEFWGATAYLEGLVEGDVGHPQIVMSVDGQAVRHVEEVVPPAPQDSPVLGVEGQDSVLRNWSQVELLEMVRRVERTAKKSFDPAWTP